MKLYDDEQRAERLFQAKERREIADEQLEKKRMQEHMQSQKKAKLVAERRIEN